MKRKLLGTVLMTGLLTAGLGCCGTGGLCGAGGGLGGSHGGGGNDCESGQCGAQAQQQQQMGHVAYPYYTVRGPRDFLADF